MSLRPRTAAMVILATCMGSAQVAQAQTSADRAIVIADAPILIDPTATIPLRVAAVGTTLIAFEEQGGWLRVQFQDPQFGLRSGYIATRFVRIERALPRAIDLSVKQPLGVGGARPATTPPPPQTAPPSPQERSGFWFNVGAGYGSLGCGTCLGERANGGSGDVSLGITLTDRVLLGVGSTGWYRSEDGVWFGAGTFDIRARFYPVRTSGIFLNGGIGLGSISIGSGHTTVKEMGGGAVLGVGWDFRISPNVSLTPFVSGAGIRTDSVNVNFVQIGVGITVH